MGAPSQRRSRIAGRWRGPNGVPIVEKVVAVHKTYGPPVILKRRDDGSLWIVRYIASSNRVEEDQAFRVENMAQY